MSMRIVIVGSGPAAVSAIEAIRRFDQASDVVMLAADSVRPYTPCFLGQYVSGRIGLDDLALRPEDFCSRLGVDLRAGDKVVAVRPAEHEVVLASGERVAYDRLLIACGAESVVPDVPGIEGQGVSGFRGLADADAIRSRLGSVREAVVLGSGFVAMEAAEALVDAGVGVTVVARRDRLLRRLFDRQVTDIVEQRIAEHGVRILKGRDLVEVIRDESDRSVTGVRLGDGAVVPCQLLVLAVGMRANTMLVEGTGIEVGAGILTDASMRTSVPDVWAAGDVAEPEIGGVRKMNLIHPNAVLTGKVAGQSIAGVGRPMASHFADMNVLTVFGTSYLSVGTLGSEDALVRVDDRGQMLKVLLEDGVVTCVQMVGNVARGGLYASLIGRRLPEGVSERLLSPEFNFGDIETWPFAE
jgi:nitrite reductase (NADH) large subunit